MTARFIADTIVLGGLTAIAYLSIFAVIIRLIQGGN